MQLCVRGAAPGFRDYGRTGYEGVARNAGNNGYSWSCTPAAGDVTVRYMDFNTQNLNPSNANYRAFGFQVRCLQHLSGSLSQYIRKDKRGVLFQSADARERAGRATR